MAASFSAFLSQSKVSNTMLHILKAAVINLCLNTKWNALDLYRESFHHELKHYYWQIVIDHLGVMMFSAAAVCRSRARWALQIEMKDKYFFFFFFCGKNSLVCFFYLLKTIFLQCCVGFCRITTQRETSFMGQKYLSHRLVVTKRLGGKGREGRTRSLRLAYTIIYRMDRQQGPTA